MRDMEKNYNHTCELDNYLIAKLKSCDNIKIFIPDEFRAKGIISILIMKKDFNNERFIKRISNEVAISTGSACSLGEPSHVINALGLKDQTGKILRISLNKFTMKKDIDQFISVLIKNI